MRLRIQKLSSKVSRLDELPTKGETVMVDITEVIELSKEEWNEFKNDMLDSYYWLKSADGIVLVKNKDGNGRVAVDTQGYDYARYTGRVIG